VIGVGGPPAASRLDQIPEQLVFETWCGLLARLQGEECAVANGRG
jgi:hypothetical protein